MDPSDTMPQWPRVEYPLEATLETLSGGLMIDCTDSSHGRVVDVLFCSVTRRSTVQRTREMHPVHTTYEYTAYIHSDDNPLVLAAEERKVIAVLC